MDGDDPELRSLVVPEALHGERLDKALVSFAPEFSRSHLQALIAAGHVRIDGKPRCTASAKVAAGQRIDVELEPTAQARAFRPEAMPLDIVFEDEQLIVLNKRAGWVVHPAAGNWSGTVLNALLAHHAGAEALARAGIVHRLDKDTSGLMVIAKTQRAATALGRAIAQRSVHRVYLAIVHGEVASEAYSIDAAIGRDLRSRVRMAIRESGKPARTDVQRLSARGGFSALRCTLHTGRTHQIRVHLASTGHPLVADALYGGSAALGLERQALHAVRLEFAHPASGVELGFFAPPPPDFANAWRQIAGPEPIS